MLRNLCLAGENERELASIGGTGVTEFISGGTRVRCTTGNTLFSFAFLRGNGTDEPTLRQRLFYFRSDFARVFLPAAFAVN